MKKKFNSVYFELSRPNFQSPLIRNIRKYALFPKDNAVTSTLINGYVYEPYMFDFIKDNLIDLNGTNVIEIGSNNGHFTLEFADFVGDLGKVYAFEPQRIIFQQLCCNIFLNGFDNVYAYDIAIGNESGFIDLEFPDYHSQDFVNFGNVGVVSSKNSNVISEKVRVEKLDNFKFNNVSILKIDVQGFEPDVIEGAKETILNNRPYIFIEIEEEQLEKFGYLETDLISKIESLGYFVRRFQIGIPYQTRNGICLDCVCIPIEKYQSQDYIIR